MTKVMTGGKRVNNGSRSQFFVGRKEKILPFLFFDVTDDYHIVAYDFCFQGATVRNEGESVVISRIVKGGTADKSGKSYSNSIVIDNIIYQPKHMGQRTVAQLVEC